MCVEIVIVSWWEILPLFNIKIITFYPLKCGRIHLFVLLFSVPLLLVLILQISWQALNFFFFLLHIFDNLWMLYFGELTEVDQNQWFALSLLFFRLKYFWVKFFDFRTSMCNELRLVVSSCIFFVKIKLMANLDLVFEPHSNFFPKCHIKTPNPWVYWRSIVPWEKVKIRPF